MLAMARLGRTAARTVPLAVIGAGAAAAQFLGVSPLLALMGGAILSLIVARSVRQPRTAAAAIAPALACAHAPP